MGVGLSQGGQAVWAANELAAEYGGGLSLLGTASLSPAADITGFAGAAADGRLTNEQAPALPLILESLKQAHPELDLDDFRRGIVKDEWDVLMACQGPQVGERNRVTDEITPDDLRPGTPAAVDTLRDYLRDMSVAHSRAAAPMLVIFGGADALVPTPWTDRALAAACAMGDVIDVRFQPDKGHSDIEVFSAFGWLNARFKGEPAANSCGELPEPPPERETEEPKRPKSPRPRRSLWNSPSTRLRPPRRAGSGPPGDHHRCGRRADGRADAGAEYPYPWRAPRSRVRSRAGAADRACASPGRANDPETPGAARRRPSPYTRQRIIGLDGARGLSAVGVAVMHVAGQLLAEHRGSRRRSGWSACA